MILESFPEEKERLLKTWWFFEWTTWLILGLSYLITFLPLGVPVYRLGVNLLFGFVALTTFIAYRVFPFEKRKGFFRYTFKLKGFEIGLSDHLFASAAILFTGGLESPFWFVYILALVAGALYLPAWALIVEGIEAVSLYLLTVGFLAPALFGYYEPGLKAEMIVVPLASFFSVLFTYVIAKSMNDEVIKNVNLARSLEEKAKEAIGEKDKLNSILASASDGIFVLDTKGGFVLMNRSAERVLGVDFSLVKNKRLWDVFTIKKNDNVEIKVSNLLNKFSGDDRFLLEPLEVRIINKKTGKESWVRLSLTGVKEGQKLNIGAIGLFQDLSKEKALEEMKLDFVSMAAHELRTPLTAVRGYLSILIEQLNKKGSADERDIVEKAFISSTNLAALVENLLSISRIESNSLKLSLSETDWKELIGQMVDQVRPQADQKKIALRLEIKSAIPTVVVDKFRISEVISNLLSNAINYTGQGGKVTVTTYVENNKLVTSVEDTGEGIPKEALPHLFTKFFRVSGILEQGSKGTGLGLYISKAIVDMHKGRIWADSVLGKGSKFTFTIPLNLKPATENEQEVLSAQALNTKS